MHLPLPRTPAGVWAELWGMGGQEEPVFPAPRAPRGWLALDSALVARRAYRLMQAAGLGPRMRAWRTRHRVHVCLMAGQPLPAPPRETLLEQADAYLLGAFLARGYMRDPDHGYHWEVWQPSPAAGALALHALARLGLSGGASPRRSGTTVYLKDAPQIAALLTRWGAHRAVLGLESAQVLRAMKNQVNRLVNSESANLRRAAVSGWAQLEAIRILRAGPGWQQLGPDLREVAELRLRHPDWSLREIGDALRPPLSKSAVARRLRRILAYAAGPTSR
ncbi:Putative sporulation transcription regulator WhiA [Candidatus Hydrogenisulfobacillus filiaventi]|uniref:Probable cell division protein WhiA n=1 Tax=Candidatus Hydrogenisulfobacillus filiaventi TaxID=2707344 RepID=A0A6F8ZH81_9FIRM|nr:Putative sporulation transcription regulator WhiA [Candidatus Hydrogenisulfobacillus filiaventi]